jgi:hypothetical protein
MTTKQEYEDGTGGVGPIPQSPDRAQPPTTTATPPPNAPSTYPDPDTARRAGRGRRVSLCTNATQR